MKAKILVILFALISSQAIAQTITNEIGITCKVIKEGDGDPLQDSIILNSMVSVLVLTGDTEVMRKDHNGQVSSNPLWFERAKLDPVFSLLLDKKIGDSLCVEIPYNENTKTFLPPNATEETVGYLYIKLVSMETFAEREAKEKAKAEKLIAEEDAQIRKYLEENGLMDKAEKTASGMYIVREGSNDQTRPVNGQTVQVHYTGVLLNGTTPFDSSVKRGVPFEFPLGQGRVIQGWDEGIALLGVGEKATLYLPSRLAYGPRGAGGAIPPNAILKFDVELIGIK